MQAHKSHDALMLKLVGIESFNRSLATWLACPSGILSANAIVCGYHRGVSQQGLLEKPIITVTQSGDSTEVGKVMSDPISAEFVCPGMI